MGDEFKSGGGPQQTAKGNAKIINNYFTAQKESVPPSFKPGTLFNVPDPPPNYFARPDDLKEFRAALLAEGTQAVGITGKRQHVGVQGMGGLGKSVLAAALAHDEDVRAAFPDGIFWLRFWQDADNAYLLEQQAEILKILAPDQLPDTLAYGENLLNLALQNKRCLFIADDLWDSKYLRHFNVKSSGCRFLLTTRNAEVIKKTGARRCELGLLSDTQAREFLALSSGCAENALPDEAAAILHECGRLPLAVAAIGSMVKGKPAQRWQMALEKLQNARLDKIPANLTDDYNYKSLCKVFEVSVDDLPPEVQAYYKTLIIFPEDAKIPESVLQLYWEHCPQGDYEPMEAVDLLVERSLLSRDRDESVTLHDLLRDYLKNQSGIDTVELRRILLNIANFLLKENEEANVLIICLKILGDDGKEVALRLLRERHEPDVISVCIEKIGDEAKEDARRFLRESWHPHVITVCLNILGNEAKEDARRLLKEHDNPLLIATCFGILGAEAKEDAKRLLKESNQPDILIACLSILGVEAKEDARRLLKESNQPDILIACLKILGDEAKEDAKHLLKEHDNPLLIAACFGILGAEAKEDAWRLLKENNQPDILIACLKILGDEAKEDARRLLIESHDADVVATCINLLGDEVKETARQMLKENHHPDVISKCLNMLGDEAKEEAKKLLRQSDNQNIIAACLKLLGDEAKEEAKCLLKESKNERVLVCCLYILGEEAKKEARKLLKTAKYEGLLVTCIRILGKEAEVDANRLIKNTKNRITRDSCREIVSSWSTSLGGKFPELARWKKNDPEE